MMEQRKTDSEKNTEKAILLGIIPSGLSRKKYAEPLAELERLAQTAGVAVIGKITQGRQKIHSSTYIGSGKIQELKAMVNELQANLVICDDDLNLAQARNLEKDLEIHVLDRTELILKIFATRAQTHEAKLQVELAQLQYNLPRLKRMWEHLDRYRSGGAGTVKGPGEKQLESDKRAIKKRIGDLSEMIQDIQKRKRLEVKTRTEKFRTVGLVGYTNAGKSTLMNALTGSDVLVEDRLFSTLDTRTRVWPISQGREVLLSDTVGFIEKLPHHLVASFRATLEEAHQADLLLHIVDVSDPDAKLHIEVVTKVLQDIGVHDRPTLLVFNKIDMIEEAADYNYLTSVYPDYVSISAKKKVNLEGLQKKVVELLETTMSELRISLPVTEGKLIAWIETHGHILEKSTDESQVHYVVKLSKSANQWLLRQKAELDSQQGASDLQREENE